VKPSVRMAPGADSALAVMAACNMALEEIGRRDLAIEMRGKVIKARGFDEALYIMMQYVEFE
jgi:hypothetical protein